MLDEGTLSWNARYERELDVIARRHSPVCTEIMMKGYRCMKKSGGVKSQCQHILDELSQCRYPDSVSVQRKPTL